MARLIHYVKRLVSMPKLLIYCSEASGGLADYAHEQSCSLANAGVDVAILAPAGYIHQSDAYGQYSLRAPSRSGTGSRLVSRFLFVSMILVGIWRLESIIRASAVRHVLFTSYSEYLAPLWAWRLRRLRKQGVQFAAVVHDPVRSYQVGPLWWHRWSIAEGYSFLHQVFVHAPIELDTGRQMPSLRVSVIPHGPFSFPPCRLSRRQARQQLAIPEQVPLLLCFGRLRTDKNLEGVLLALRENPSTHLLVAGPDATHGQRKSSEFRQMAESLGVADRCHWQVWFHTPEEAAQAFSAADAAVLAYSASFRSASGVLNVAARYRIPVIASGGDGALTSAVSQFALGIVIPPDDTPELVKAIAQLFRNPPAPNWEGYLQANSWEANARQVINAMGLEAAHA
jgi:glycosyltransferase involved in cell wall biosynthesis